MSKVEIFNHSMSEIGYTARTATTGDEFKMVQQYILYLEKKYQKLKSKSVAIFIEPQLDTGYPDIVIVEYNHSLKFELKRELSINDLKILFHIQKQKSTTTDSLKAQLGFTDNDIEKTLKNLNQHKLIRMNKANSNIRNVKIRNYCAINKIISIEAKIDKWSEAIQQASKNIWFSTESYILMNKNSCNESIVKKCKESGIGIILVNGSIKVMLKSEKRAFPVSYSSLLFNEWLQKYDFVKGKTNEHY